MDKQINRKLPRLSVAYEPAGPLPENLVRKPIVYFGWLISILL